MQRKDFINVKRIVIKLGTNVLRNEEGEVAVSRIYSFIEDISKLVKSGKEVIVVTSGAVGLGKKKLNLDSTEGDGVKQACAAVGQSRLMSYYETGFGTYEIKSKDAREGINPKTGEKIQIDASKTPVFKFGKAYKDLF